MHHPVADPADQPRFLGHGNEDIGRDVAEFGMGPAQESLEAGELAVRGLDDRLVDQAQLATLQRVAQGDFDPASMLGMSMERWFIAAMDTATIVLGAVKR